MKIRELSSFRGKDCFAEYLSGINSIRSNYQWAEKIYDENNIDNIYLVSSSGSFVGFIECTYRNLDFCSDSSIILFLHEIHIAPSMRRKGIGSAVLKHLLKKGVSLEMIVVNENENMLALVNKFNAEHKYITKNTRTVFISP